MSARTKLSLWLRTVCVRPLTVALAATACLLHAVPLRAQIASSYVSLNHAESELKYYSRGIMRASGPPNTKPVNGQWPVVELPADPDKFWRMAVSFTGDGFTTVHDSNTKTDHEVVRKAGVLLNPGAIGLHIPAPHKDENPNNQLPELRPAELPNLSLEYFALGPAPHTETFMTGAYSTNFGRVAHGVKHFDYFAYSAELAMSTFGGTVSLEANELKVFAEHGDEAHAEKFDEWINNAYYRVGSDPAFRPADGNNTPPDPSGDLPPRSMFYDATSRTVTIAPALINVLNRSGDPSHGLDPEFANDSLVNAIMQVSPLQVVQSPEGFFSLSGGEVQIENNQTGVRFSAHFDEMSLGGEGDPLGGGHVGLLSTGSINYLPQEQVSFSAEMASLVAPDGIDSDYTPLGLLLEPGVPLQVATNNFTQSAMLPLAMSLAGLRDEPGLAGDFDSDGDVDQDDLVVWQANYGLSMDGRDFLTWQREYGSHTHDGGHEGFGLSRLDHLGGISAIAQNVPEPTSMMLGFVALALGIVCRR